MIWRSDILMATDYYPFGMAIPERQWYTGSDSSNYRYGFNGHEKDNEVKGPGNSLDFGARIYDCRLARFLSLDPKIVDYPFLSPYTFAGNMPISCIDKNGNSPWPVINAFFGKYFGGFSSLEEGRKVDKNFAHGRWTCKDLVIEMLINYADLNRMPIEFKKGEVTYSSNDFKTKKHFKNCVMANFGAEDLRNSGLFTSKGMTNDVTQRMNIQKGDVLFTRRGGAPATHVQVVVEKSTVTPELINQWKSEGKQHLVDNFKEGDVFAKIIQGNIDELWLEQRGIPIPNSSPSSIFYDGVDPQYGYYNLSSDTFVRDGYGGNQSTTNFSTTDTQEIMSVKND